METQNTDQTQTSLDAVTLARVDAASRREAKRLANLTPDERREEERRTAPIARDNKPFSLFRS